MDPVKGLNPADVEAAIRKDTRLVAVTHISNITGTVNPLDEIGALCRSRGIIFLVDAAQSAGERPIDVNRSAIDLLAFPGHKGLLGPQGTGGLYIAEGVDLEPRRQGGTGSHSELLSQPDELPDRFESGTVNVPGLAGLAAGMEFIQATGFEVIRQRYTLLANRLIEGFLGIDGVVVYGPPAGSDRAPVVSIRLGAVNPAEISSILDNSFGIATRAGLHCASDAHATLGTIDRGGTVRFSPGYFTTADDVDVCIDAVRKIRNSFL
jgi:selenocysteine lyase/cysteine desulfurase